MATYGILRVEKLKKLTNLKGSLMHAFREQDTPNADPARKGQNILLTPDANNVESTMAKYEQLKPKEGKIRSDVVHALEVLVTASPEKIRAMNTEERNAYFNDALRFCNAKFGEGNLLHAQIHNDETTAHLTAFYIPVIEKRKKNGEVSRRLNASSYLGGKKEYSARQSEFYEQVSKKYGMERGEIGSKATHKKVLDWYKELNAEQLGADFENVVGKLAQNQITVEVEEMQPKLIGGLFGAKYETRTVEKQVKTREPIVPLPSARDALRPYQNSNSEMKRREKEAWKKEVRKEVQEEEKEKLKQEKEQLANLQQQAKETKGKYDSFYLKIYNKLKDVMPIEKKTYQEIEKSLFLFIDKFSDVISKLENEVQEITKKYNVATSLWKEYEEKFYQAETESNATQRRLYSVIVENETLNQKIKDLEKPQNFDDLKASYYVALENKAKDLIDGLDDQLRVANSPPQNTSVKEKAKALNHYAELYDKLTNLDELYAQKIHLERQEQYLAARKYVDDNKHLLNLLKPSM